MRINHQPAIEPNPAPVPLRRWFGRCLWLAIAILGIKSWLAILWEYRWYFPPNFDEAAFLIGRRDLFETGYRYAFYSHIVASPIAIALGAGLFISARFITTRPAVRQNGRDFTGISVYWNWHRFLGKVQIFTVAFLVAPSGLIMAWGTLFGPISAIGFSVHSLATFFSAVAAIYFARLRKVVQHEFWATACFILLCGPLVFRLTSGIAIATGLETPFTYQLNAWTSWLTPLVLWLLWKRIK